MAQHRVFYKCEICLREALTLEECHGHQMVEVDAGAEGDAITQPVTDDAGHILSHAPKWWVYRRQAITKGLPHR